MPPPSECLVSVPARPDGAASDAAVAVIVPYYQRESGILRRALRSVFEQKGAPPVHVFVVDDAAPMPASVELDGLDPAERRRVTLLRRENGGPGAARNTGLSAVPAATPFVAFLDSDDIWHERHLARAIAALEHGCDFFFADHRRDGCADTAFEAAGFERPECRPIDLEQNLFEYQGNLFKAVLAYSPVGTSTVVFRNDRIGTTRFIESVRTCEDLLFWLSVAKSPARIAFGRDIQVSYGKGVNIYASITANSNEELQEKANCSVFFAEIARRFPLNPEEQALLDQKSSRNRENFARSVLSMLVRGRPIDWALCRDFVRKNPSMLLRLPAILGSEATTRLFGFRASNRSA